MMIHKRLWVVVTITLTIVVFMAIIKSWSTFPHRMWEGSLVRPGFSGQKSLPTPIPTQAPRQYKFDNSTDLKQELETVDPQILEEDFKDL